MANLFTRADKGSALTFGEVDANFLNLNSDIEAINQIVSNLPTDEGLNQLIAKLRDSRKVYVSLDGNNSNNGTSSAEPLRTLQAAALAAQPGDVVIVGPGAFVEAVLPIRWKYDVTVFGAGLRSTIVQPAPGQEFNDIFKVDSGFWVWGVSFAGHQADDTRQAWAIDFDELADNTARGAVGLGAFILKSPYIQNCTSITAEDDAGTAGSVSTGNTGGGIRVDGTRCAINSPIRSMVVDSYTQVNLGGPGCLVLNDGYAQLVSFFGTFCTYHVRTETGGQVNLSGGGTTDFGLYGLMADGYSRSPLFTGSARVAAYGAPRLEKTVTINVSTDTFGCVDHGLVAGDQVTFKASQGSLPTNLAANTTYFVLAGGLTADALQVSTTAGGSVLDMTGSATGTYQVVRQGVTQLDVIGFSANRLGRQIKYPTAGSAGSPGNPVSITARGGSTPGSSFTVTLGTSTVGHQYVGGGTVTVAGVSYPITSATYTKSTGVTVLTAAGYAPTIGATITLSGLSFICDSSSRPNAGQLMFPQLVFPRNAGTGAAEAKTFAYTRTGDFTLTFTEAAAPAGPEHEYVSGGTVVIDGTDYGVAAATYNKTTGVVTLTTVVQLPAGNGNVTVDALRFICPTSAYIVTSSVPIDASGVEVANSSPNRAGYRVNFFSGLNGGLRDPVAANQVLDFRNRSQISAPSHTFEFVGSGTNYDALPTNGGVPVDANAIVETNNGRVFSSNTNEKGDFKVGSQFSVDGTSGSVTINTDQFNLSGLNFIGPFSRNGGISSVGVQIREASNNTNLIASTGGADGNTVPTQFAVKSYADAKFLQDVTVTAGLPLTITDTSTQDGQGYWVRTRNLSISTNVANGLAQLNGSGLIPSALLPSYVDDVLEFANLAAFPATGETEKIYVDLDTNKTYRWTGSTYVEISQGADSTDLVPEGSTNLYFTQARARQSISASGSLSYDSATGVMSFTAPAQIGTDLSYTAASRLLESSTGADVTLPLFTSSAAGLVPSSGGGTTTFLRADGTFAVPPGTGAGSVTSVGLTVPTGLNVSGSPITGSGTLAISLASGYTIPTTAELDSFLTSATAATTYQPLDSDLTAIAALSTTSFGRALLALADAAAGRSTLAAAGTGVANTFTAAQVFEDDVTLDDGGTYATTLQLFTPTANRTISFPDATGTVALVSGSNQQVTYNDAGAQAGGNLVYDKTAGTFGYGAAGGTVTQAANKTTGVTLNAPCGTIVMNGASLSADTTATFVLTNSSIAANDMVLVSHSSVGTFGAYTLNGRAAAGSASIDVRNVSTGSLSEAIVIRFAVVKAVTS